MLQDVLRSESGGGQPVMTVADVKEYTQALSRDAISRCSTDAMRSTEFVVHDALSTGFSSHRYIFSTCELEDCFFSEMVLSRAQTEPSEGLCDMVALRPAVFKTPRLQGTVACSLDCSFIIPQASPSYEVDPQCEVPRPFLGIQGRYHGHPPEDYDLKWTPGGVRSLPEISPAKSDGPFMLPFIVALCIASYEGYWDSTQRMSIHLVSAVDLYANLGVKDHPVWGLLIGGMRCGVLMAWRSSVNNVSSCVVCEV